MKDGRCTKHYPRSFTPVTVDNKDGYPIYRRRDDGRIVLIRGVQLDNRWVVPYNKPLLNKYNCHINVEYCASIR